MSTESTAVGFDVLSTMVDRTFIFPLGRGGGRVSLLDGYGLEINFASAVNAGDIEAVKALWPDYKVWVGKRGLWVREMDERIQEVGRKAQFLSADEPFRRGVTTTMREIAAEALHASCRDWEGSEHAGLALCHLLEKEWPGWSDWGSVEPLSADELARLSSLLKEVWESLFERRISTSTVNVDVEGFDKIPDAKCVQISREKARAAVEAGRTVLVESLHEFGRGTFHASSSRGLAVWSREAFYADATFRKYVGLDLAYITAFGSGPRNLFFSVLVTEEEVSSAQKWVDEYNSALRRGYLPGVG